MTADLHKALVEYAKWYLGRFGAAEPDWYLFPFGKPRPADPTRPQTSLRTAWRKVRSKAQVQGRWHDNRHTFVTDLTEGANSDRLIQELAGHVSKRMIERYSHVRMQARRYAIEEMSARNEKRAKTRMAEQNRKRVTAVSTVVERPN